MRLSNITRAAFIAGALAAASLVQAADEARGVAETRRTEADAAKELAEQRRLESETRLARSNVVWTKPFTRTLDESQAPFYKWFDDGELNASANCLDRHMGTPVENKTAVIFEADDGAVTKTSYKELLAKVSQFANALKANGIVVAWGENAFGQASVPDALDGPEEMDSPEELAALKYVIAVEALGWTGVALLVAGAQALVARVLQDLRHAFVVRRVLRWYEQGADVDRRMQDAVALAARYDADVLCEEFIEGDEFTYDTVSVGGTPVFENVAQYLPKPLIARSNEWISPVIVTVKNLAQPAVMTPQPMEHGMPGPSA